MKRSRSPLLGCLGLIVLGGALFAINAIAHRAAYDGAESRWAEKGGPNYTLVVRQACFCPMLDEYRITVRDGRVVSGVEIRDPARVFSPSKFNDFTVEAVLAKARDIEYAAWTVPWFRTASVTYDPTYGYVTRLETDAGGVLAPGPTDSSYAYMAHDLVLEEP